LTVARLRAGQMLHECRDRRAGHAFPEHACPGRCSNDYSLTLRSRFAKK
jgi:hypothetical protein